MLISEAESYLEHYGKLGMRWGVRSASKSSGSAPKSKKEKVEKTPEQKAKQKATIKKVAAVTLAVGATATRAILRANRDLTMDALRQPEGPVFQQHEIIREGWGGL